MCIIYIMTVDSVSESDSDSCVLQTDDNFQKCNRFDTLFYK